MLTTDELSDCRGLACGCFGLIMWGVDELFVCKEVKVAEDSWKLHPRLSIEMGVGHATRFVLQTHSQGVGQGLWDTQWAFY
jgi:hypothetical protein